MPPKRNKRAIYVPKEHELVPSDEYATDDSFNESQRMLVSGEVSKSRLELLETTLKVLEKRVKRLPKYKGLDTSRFDNPVHVQYARAVNREHARTQIKHKKMAVSDEMARTKKSPHPKKTRPKQQSKKKATEPCVDDPDYVPSSSEDDDVNVSEVESLPTPSKTLHSTVRGKRDINYISLFNYKYEK